MLKVACQINWEKVDYSIIIVRKNRKSLNKFIINYKKTGGIFFLNLGADKAFVKQKPHVVRKDW